MAPARHNDVPALPALLSSLPEIVSIAIVLAVIFFVEAAVARSAVVLVGDGLWGTKYRNGEGFGAAGVLRRAI